MTLNSIAALLTLAIIITAALTNASKIIRHQVEATLSSWLIFLAGTTTSFLSYLASSHKNFTGGVLNGADVLGDLIVVFSIIFFAKTGWRLKSFEKYYLIGLILIVVFWFFTADAFHSNLLIQILLAFGYLPTVHNLIKFKRNTESFAVWGLILVASIIGTYPAFYSWKATGNILAIVYSVRSVVLIAVLMLLMYIYRPKQA